MLVTYHWVNHVVLQDCSVGLMFALMPAFGAAAAVSRSRSAPGSVAASSSHGDAGGPVLTADSTAMDTALLGAAMLLLRVMLKLVVVLAGAMAVARTVLPVLLRLLLK